MGTAILEPLSLMEKNPQVTPKIEAVVLKCLAQNPSDRFSGTLDLLNALKKALKGVQIGQDYQPIQITKPRNSSEQIGHSDSLVNQVAEVKPQEIALPDELKKQENRKMKLAWPWVLLGLVLVMGFVFLAPKFQGMFLSPSPIAVLDMPDGSSPTPMETAIPNASPSLEPTALYLATSTPILSGVNVFTQTPEVTSSGSIITADNVKNLKETSRLGRGSAEQAIWSPDGQLIAVASSTGIYFYDFNNLEQTNYINAVVG